MCCPVKLNDRLAFELVPCKVLRYAGPKFPIASSAPSVLTENQGVELVG